MYVRLVGYSGIRILIDIITNKVACSYDFCIIFFKKKGEEKRWIYLLYEFIVPVNALCKVNGAEAHYFVGFNPQTLKEKNNFSSKILILESTTTKKSWTEW